MKSMKLSAIVLSLAAASAFAQAAPANTATEAPKAEAAPTTEATQPAEAPKADVQPAEPAPAPAEEAKVEETKAAEPAPAVEPVAEPQPEQKEELVKAEEPKPAEVVQKEEPKTKEKKSVAKQEPVEIPLAERINISKADAAPEAKKAMEFKVSGAAEFDVYAYWKNNSATLWNNYAENDLYHSYASTFDLDFQVKFNEQWSAQIELEADGKSASPGSYYNGAFVQYQKNENIAFKFGDLTHSEGGFNYYDYDDPAINAAGMAEHDIRGVELDLYGLQLALGFGRGTNDNLSCNPINAECRGKSYDVHAAYQLEFAGQTLRPFAHYKSWQEAHANELHAGLEAALEFGPFAIHAVYGLHADNLTEDEPTPTHAFLFEPAFKVANVNVKGGIFYAMFNDNMEKATVHDDEIPEYLFAYGEGDIKLNNVFTIGLLGELHTNSLDDDTDLGSLNFGSRLYITPVDGLDITVFAMAILPMGDDWENSGDIKQYDRHSQTVSTTDYGEDLNLKFGVETVFSF